MVYNTVTHRNEEVEVTHDVYHAYRRTGWGIENNDTSFFAHEIQMSGLIGGEEGAYENFKEFIDTENIPDNTVLKIMEIDALRKALSVLSDADKRARYDQFGHAGVDPNFAGAGGGASHHRGDHAVFHQEQDEKPPFGYLRRNGYEGLVYQGLAADEPPDEAHAGVCAGIRGDVLLHHGGQPGADRFLYRYFSYAVRQLLRL